MEAVLGKASGVLGRLEHGVAREGSCAVLIQNKYRGKLEHRSLVKAAVKVQAVGRGSKVRRDLETAKRKLQAELEALEKMGEPEAEDAAPKRTKSEERRRAEDEEDGGGQAIALRHQRPDPDVEPAELQRQLKLYVNQLEKQEREVKKAIEKIKRERPYLNAADQRGNTEKRTLTPTLTLTLPLTLTLTLTLIPTLTLTRQHGEAARSTEEARGGGCGEH